MIKSTHHKHHNSPPHNIIYYNTDNFDKFVSNYIYTIDFIESAGIKIPEININKEKKEMVVSYENRRYFYKMMTVEEMEEVITL